MLPEGRMNPTRDQTRFPSANGEGRSGSKGESSLFQNCMNWRLNICLLDKSTATTAPRAAPRLSFWPKRRSGSGMGFRGLAAKEEHEPLDSHGLLGCRIQAPSHLIPAAALPA